MSIYSVIKRTYIESAVSPSLDSSVGKFTNCAAHFIVVMLLLIIIGIGSYRLRRVDGCCLVRGGPPIGQLIESRFFQSHRATHDT